MSVRYPYDPFALPERPDISLLERASPAPRPSRLVAGLAAVGGFSAAAFGLGCVLFVPVLIGELGRIDALIVSGETVPTYSFAGRLRDLFFGTLILSVAIVSFLAAAALSSGPMYRPDATRPGHRPLSKRGRSKATATTARKVKHVQAV